MTMTEPLVPDDEDVDVAENNADTEKAQTPTAEVKRPRPRLLTALVLPLLCMLMALGVGYLKWKSDAQRQAMAAESESVAAATDGVTRMLSYRFDTADKDLKSATDTMTGSMRQDYTKLITDVVIPGAVQKRISSETRIPAAASITATGDHAEVLLYINQIITFGNDKPALTTSSARVTLEKVDGRWLMSDFQQVT